MPDQDEMDRERAAAAALVSAEVIAKLEPLVDASPFYVADMDEVRAWFDWVKGLVK